MPHNGRMPDKAPSPAEPVYALRRIPIRENGEPLVDFLEACPGAIPAAPVFEYTHATLVRKSVAEMLNRAIAALPEGYRLGILEGWRPRYIQRRMYLTSWLRFKKLHPDWSDLQVRRVLNRMVAPPDAAVPPPHSTGGAVDVFLVDDEGERIDLYSPYEMFDPRCYPAFAKGLSETALRNRTILREAMLAGGMTNYPSEWWHWSYGDQGWAYRGPQVPGDPWPEAALYGRIDAPEGWEPVAGEDEEVPLARIRGGGSDAGFPVVKE